MTTTTTNAANITATTPPTDTPTISSKELPVGDFKAEKYVHEILLHEHVFCQSVFEDTLPQS